MVEVAALGLVFSRPPDSFRGGCCFMRRPWPGVIDDEEAAGVVVRSCHRPCLRRPALTTTGERVCVFVCVSYGAVWSCGGACGVWCIVRSLVGLEGARCSALCVQLHCDSLTMERRASDKCQREKRKTINGDDLLWAMSTLGFEDYVEPLKVYLHKYREVR